MKKKNILKLIKQLEKTKHLKDQKIQQIYEGEAKPINPEKPAFSMNYDFLPSSIVDSKDYRIRCSSPSCLAGWASVLSGEKDPNCNPYEIAANWLGLNYGWANAVLFYPELDEKYDNLTPKRAIKALKRVIKAGKNYDDLDAEEVWSK